MYEATSSRPPRGPAYAGSSAIARRSGHARSAATPGTPRRTASAIAISALAPSIVPASPVASGHFGWMPRPSPNATSERAAWRALSGQSHA
jgi:hypothetical protein